MNVNNKLVFAHSKYLQASLMFESKAGTYPSGENLRYSTLWKTPGLTPNIRLG